MDSFAELMALLDEIDRVGAMPKDMRGHIPCMAEDNVVPEGMHKHHCGCGATWKHDNRLPRWTTKPEFEHAHSCPACGQGGIYEKFGEF